MTDFVMRSARKLSYAAIQETKRAANLAALLQEAGDGGRTHDFQLGKLTLYH